MSRSLIPFPLGLDWWNSWDYPARIFDQHFGLGLSDDDFLPPRIYRGYLVRPRRQDSRQMPSSGLSEVANMEDKFKVSVDVSHFKPEELTVKTVDNYLVIHGKHEEKKDEHGFVSREFTRKYMLPRDAQPESVVSSVSSNGVLTVEAPKVKGQLLSNERVVPIAKEETPAAKKETPASQKGDEKKSKNQ